MEIIPEISVTLSLSLLSLYPEPMWDDCRGGPLFSLLFPYVLDCRITVPNTT
jgi:hypothetical protein